MLLDMGMAKPVAFWDYDGFDPIRVQIQLRHIEVDALEAYLAEQTIQMRNSAEVGSKVFMVIDARAGMRPPPEIRRMQADWLAENQENMTKSVIGIAFVVENRMVRGAMTAIFWVSSPPIPYNVFGSLEEAMAHAVETCDAAGLQLPPKVRRDPAAHIETQLSRYLARAG